MASQKNNYKFTLREKITIASGVGASFLISKDLELNQTVVVSNASITIMDGDKIERFIGTCAGDYFTIVLRGLEQGDTHVSNAALKQDRPAGAEAFVTVFAGDMLDVSSPDARLITTPLILDNVIFNATGKFCHPKYSSEAARDAAIVAPIDGMWIYRDDLGLNQKRIGGTWVDDIAGSIGPNLSLTTLGKGKWAGTAQFLAGTDLDGSDPLLPRCSDIKTTVDGINTAISNLGNSIGGASFVLGETISANKLVSLLNDGSANGKIYRYVGNGSNQITGGGSGSAVSYKRCIALSATTIVVMIVDNVGGIYVSAATIANNVLTFGATQSWTPTSWAIFTGSVDICKTSATGFAIAWGYQWFSGGNSQFLQARAGSVSGNTITIGAINTITNNATVQSVSSICMVTTDKFAISYTASTATVVVCTIAANVITAGTPVSSLAIVGKACFVSTDKFAITDGSNIRLYTVSGTAVTQGNNLAIGTTYSPYTMKDIGGGKAIYTGTVSTNTQAFIVDSTGATPTKGTTVTVLAASTSTDGVFAGSDQVVVVTGGNKAYYYRFSGTTLTAIHNVTLPNTIAENCIDYCAILEFITINTYTTSAAVSGQFITDMKYYVTGVLKTAGVLDDSRFVTFNGGNHTGLTAQIPGAPLYSNSIGDLVAYSGDIFVGRVTSPTSVVIAIPYNLL